MKLQLDFIDWKAAKLAVERWHYSRAMPACKLVKIGVWEEGRFIGAVIFGVGACPTMVKRFGLKPEQGCELVRVALRGHVAPVSQIVAIALRMLRKQCPGLKLVVSYADPAHGHHGGIYQAGNWIYTGQTDPDRSYWYRGRLVHCRTLTSAKARGVPIDWSKIRTVETPPKHRYVMPLDRTVAMQIANLARPYPNKSV